MADRSVAVNLIAKVSGFVSGMKTAETAAKNFATRGLDKVAAHEGSIRTLSTGIGALGLAMVGFAGMAVKRFADFDEAMSSVQAATMESASNMDLLRDAALDAGARTVYSATESASAIEELAKAGISTADILNGGLDGALDLAAAGGIAVGEAAETAASAMTQFGLKGQDVTHIADLLAAGAGKAQGGVSDLGAALNQSGLVASQMGLSIDETVGSLTAFASAGLTGSDAGTSFKAMLLRLANPTGKSAELMDDLGLSVYNAQGDFIGMEALAGQLQDRLGGLSQEQRNAALATIFGQDAIRTASILYSEGADGIAEWTSAVDDQGYAAQQAALRLDNLKGDLEQLGGAFETWLIEMGSGADGPLRGLVQGVTSVIEKFGGLPPAVQSGTLALVGGGGLVALGVAGLARLVIGISHTRDAMKNLNLSFSGIGKSAGKILGKVGLFTVALVALGEAGKKAEEAIYGTAAGTNELAQGLSSGNFDVAFEHLSGAYDTFGESLRTLTSGGLIDKVDRGMSSLNQLFGGHLPDDVQRARDAFAGVGEQLASMVESGNAKEAQAQFAAMAKKAAEYGVTQEQLLDLMPAYKDAQIGLQDGQYKTASATDTATASIEDQTDALNANNDEMKTAAGLVLDLRSAQRNLEGAIDDAKDALKENGKTLDITTEKGRKNQDALDDIASSGWDVIDSMKENGASQKDLQGTMSHTREAFIKAARQFGLTKKEASDLADEMGLIPSEVHTDVKMTGTGEVMGDLHAIYASTEALDGKTAVITTRHRDVYESVRRANGGNPNAMPMRAAGGPVSNAQTYLVGENGPELFTPAVTGHITNMSATRAMYGADAMSGPAVQSVSLSGLDAPNVAVYVQSPVDRSWVRAEAADVVNTVSASSISSVRSSARRGGF